MSVCVLSHQQQELLFCVLLWIQFPQENLPWNVCGCSSSSLSPSLSCRFLFTLPGVFERKAPCSPKGLLNVRPDEPHTAVRACLSVTAETWRWWAEWDAHTEKVCITYVDTQNSHKEHLLSWLSKVRLQLSRAKEESRYKVKNANTQQMFRSPLSFYTEPFIFPNLDVYRIQEKKKKVNYNSQF